LKPLEKFEIGEIAYAIASTGEQAECQIVSSLYNYNGDIGHDITINGDKCTAPDSKTGEFFIELKYLRKKKPPKFETGSWEELEKLGWNPTKVQA